MLQPTININSNFNSFNLLPLFERTINAVKRHLNTHNYTKLVCGIDYMCELIDDGRGACMTGFGQNVKPGNYIVWEQNNQSYCYQVQEVDYYFDPSDMWIAKLKPECCIRRSQESGVRSQETKPLSV